MNPRALKSFLTSKFGFFVAFVAVLFTGLFVYGQQDARAKQAGRPARSAVKGELGQMQAPLSDGLEDGVPRQAPNDKPGKNGIVPFRTVALNAAPAKAPAAERAAKAPEKPRKIRYQTLLAAYDAPPPSSTRTETAPPKRFVPFGTLLKCKLVNTVDSANLETPVIAILLEDVWQNGERVIPANTLVHGTARAGRLRDRITATGTWRLVWQDGRELAFPGIALDREYDQNIDGYGITDGSAGLKGSLMASDDAQELKMMASAALSGFARGTQDRTQTVLGTSVVGSLSNGAREGAANVFDLYAQRTLRDIEQNGYFVRVAAGKEFYVYVGEAIDPAKAKIAGTKVEPPQTPPPASPTSSEPEPKTKG
jgi:hypothetical protein